MNTPNHGLKKGYFAELKWNLELGATAAKLRDDAETMLESVADSSFDVFEPTWWAVHQRYSSLLLALRRYQSPRQIGLSRIFAEHCAEDLGIVFDILQFSNFNREEWSTSIC